MQFNYISLLGALAIIALGICMPSTAASQLSIDVIEIERESNVFMRRGEGVVTQIDFDVFLSRLLVS